jgi:hypothetical protein
MAQVPAGNQQGQSPKKTMNFDNKRLAEDLLTHNKHRMFPSSDCVWCIFYAHQKGIEEFLAPISQQFVKAAIKACSLCMEAEA